MKKIVLSVLVCLLAYNLPSIACIVAGGAPTPVAPATEACPNSNPDDLTVTQYSSVGTLNTTKIVITQAGVDSTGATIDLIVGLSDNGSFDFVASDGSILPYGDYQFWAFSYDQTALNTLAANLNPLLPLLGYPSIPVGADGNVNLADVFSTLNLVFPGLSVQDVEYAICSFLPGLGFGLDYGLSSSYTVTWQASGCIIGLDNLDKNLFSADVNVNGNTATVQLNTNKTTQVAVYSLNGTLVEQFVASTSSFSFPIDQYNNGLYILKATDGTNVATTKFVK